MGRMLTRANNYVAQTMYQAVLSALQVFLFNPHNYPEVATTFIPMF